MNQVPATCCPILFRDQWIVIVNKPADVLSHPNPVSPADRGKNLRQMRAAFDGRYDFAERRFDTPKGRVWLIHRLDRDVSGALMAALDPVTAKRLRVLFDEHRVKKEYAALVSGTMPGEGKWNDHLGEKREKDRVRAFVHPTRPPNAQLHYWVQRAFPGLNLSLLKMELVTGKTHQIRVQSVFHGHPVAGDRVYGHFALNRRLKKAIGLGRIFLHAQAIGFQHPQTGQFLKIRAPLPQELEHALEQAS